MCDLSQENVPNSFPINGGKRPAFELVANGSFTRLNGFIEWLNGLLSFLNG